MAHQGYMAADTDARIRALESIVCEMNGDAMAENSVRRAALKYQFLAEAKSCCSICGLAVRGDKKHLQEVFAPDACARIVRMRRACESACASYLTVEQDVQEKLMQSIASVEQVLLDMGRYKPVQSAEKCLEVVPLGEDPLASAAPAFFGLPEEPPVVEPLREAEVESPSAVDEDVDGGAAPDEDVESFLAADDDDSGAALEEGVEAEEAEEAAVEEGDVADDALASQSTDVSDGSEALHLSCLSESSVHYPAVFDIYTPANDGACVVALEEFPGELEQDFDVEEEALPDADARPPLEAACGDVEPAALRRAPTLLTGRALAGRAARAGSPMKTTESADADRQGQCADTATKGSYTENGPFVPRVWHRVGSPAWTGGQLRPMSTVRRSTA